jgi:sodium/potassium/calcium exchanger 6
MKILIIPVGLILLLILMYILSSTADEYLSPALEYITERFKISESLAGVTFLAFGNGAPDVFSSISSANSAAISDGNTKDQKIGDNTLPVCALLGSTIYLSPVILGLVNFYSIPGKKT